MYKITMFKQLTIYLFIYSIIQSHFLPIICDNQNQNQDNSDDTALYALGGGLALLLFAPIVAPIFAASGLFGAAAYSSGLAALGGGSLASGGLGMAGGSAVLAATGMGTGIGIKKIKYNKKSK